ncbi:MAG TPA: hypothetical protein VLZ30_10345 [Verrucomicrobiae bacterium]|nr:hypothetical protein [Verrucomicrobiae bacterium]
MKRAAEFFGVTVVAVGLGVLVSTTSLAFGGSGGGGHGGFSGGGHGGSVGGFHGGGRGGFVGGFRGGGRGGFVGGFHGGVRGGGYYHGYGHYGGYGHYWHGGWGGYPCYSFSYGWPYYYGYAGPYYGGYAYPYDDSYYDYPPAVDDSSQPIYSAPPPAPAPTDSPQPKVIDVAQGNASNQVPSVADVKAMVKAGIGEEVILSHLRNSQAVYHMTTAEIIDLKNSGVSEKVIDYMINTASAHR